MYYKTAVRTMPRAGDPNWDRIVSRFSRTRRVHRLGDTCWLNPTGQQVCGAGDPTGQVAQPVCLDPNKPQNRPTTPGNINGAKQNSITTNGNSFTWTVKFSGTYVRTYNFAYHAGTTDVYIQSGGPSCTGCRYGLVQPDGTVSTTDNPPARQEPPCNVQDPLQPTTPTPGTDSTCYVQPGTGQLVCGSSALVYPAGSTSTWPSYPYGSAYGGTSPYVNVPTQAAAATPASGFSLSNLPTWAIVAGGGVGAVVLMKFLGKR